MGKRIIYIYIVLSLFMLEAKIFSYQMIHNFPTSIEKDYYIWCYLKDENITKEEAKKIVYDISRTNKHLEKAYKEKTDENITKEMIRPIEELNVPRKSKVITKENRLNQLTKKNTKIQKKKNKKALASYFVNKNKENRWHPKRLVSEIYIFNQSGPKNRKEYFDKNLSSSVVKKLATNKSFNKSIEIIFKEELPLLKASLLNVVSRENRLSSLNHFKLGIYAVKSQKYAVAQNYFYYSADRAESQWRKDKANFWHYLISKNKDSLEKLFKSTHVNLYTLLAYDVKDKAYAHIEVPKFLKKYKPRFDIKNPIEWARIKRMINDPKINLTQLADRFRYEDTIGIYSFIKAQAENYTTSYFPMPYRGYLKQLPKEKQALLYAIARQETRFIPSSVSPTFALGMMQFMPFLAKEIAEKKSDELHDFEMFNPKKALEYGVYHLDYLSRYIHHPLFIGYAYNGGIGFTKKLLQNKNYFREGPYEPYLSMESMPNIESREYGKRILVNYVVYMNQLGVKTRMTTLINQLNSPNKTDKYRVESK